MDGAQPNGTAAAVLVTGASRGLGRAIAVAFASEGALVGIGYKDRDDDAKETESLVAAPSC